MSDRRPTPDRKTWLALRRRYLTASDIGAAAGIDEYKSPLRLFAEKRGTVPDVEETAIMTRGTLFEPAAIGYLQRRMPDWSILQPGLFYTDEATRLGATPDAFARSGDELVNVQIKTVARPSFERWNGVPPLKYQLQVACENMLVGATRGILAVLVVSAYDAFLETFDVPRHLAAELRITNIASEFWRQVESGIPPQPDYARDAATIAALFPPSPDVPVPLDLSTDNRIGPLLERRELFKAVEKRAKERAAALEAELVAKMAGAELAMTPEWKISRKMQHRAEKLVKASDFPVLRITRLKEEVA